MKSRLVAGVAALAVAILGVVLVIAYANGADARAMAGMQPTQVLVVTKAVAQGTAADKLGDSVQLRSLPAEAVAPSALHSLDGTAGKVVAAALQPGEQLLANRLASPESLVLPGTVPVPAGLQEVSFQLDPQRAVGGRLAAGDTIGVFLSFDKGAVASGGPESTNLTFNSVLITSVQTLQQGSSSNSSSASPSNASGTTASTAPILVTVAVTAPQASKIVFTAEYGKIWVSKQPAGTPQVNPGPVDRGKVYQ
ncbi:RcpC/CpaB family pilus assembly protein [Sinomonas sp. ASV322]|uniref:Flp pilus assembly protein CpaB n=1 Tax=Sinomonas sp. ASV322 TaxID=3041920 RepID=UPI0027DB0F3E|nr:RcpC/CpaB family pilus assembly protein [Sinomonas sp. ASV322]MDQ4501868.1 RcpC/CpaB family pilus assembly protein [Sinomonas sp. ASV322]